MTSPLATERRRNTTQAANFCICRQKPEARATYNHTRYRNRQSYKPLRRALVASETVAPGRLQASEARTTQRRRT
ncbi:hypothetical protein BD310DRAFT_922464 [Dichomitus squalens]|uniref:Uncharacterized protein n=1 Tax=Dichomitus squalens TaxID=114155 RepID=A0A4Q9Q0M5_9APHY|nr:hypothetical protein BD310DRAFT_922464 [Dichomitus squalens]